MDWIRENLRLPITYGYELRDQGRYGFLLPSNQIIPTGEEVLDSLVAMFKAYNDTNKKGKPGHNKRVP